MLLRTVHRGVIGEELSTSTVKNNTFDKEIWFDRRGSTCQTAGSVRAYLITGSLRAVTRRDNQMGFKIKDARGRQPFLGRADNADKIHFPCDIQLNLVIALSSPYRMCCSPRFLYCEREIVVFICNCNKINKNSSVCSNVSAVSGAYDRMWSRR